MHVAQLLVQIAAILGLSRVLVRLLRRVGQPSVIAEIVAGIALGPSVLGLIWPGGLALLFPAESLGVLGLVAQLGLVFFMFLVGLEFDPRLLRGQGKVSVAISNAGILAPFGLGAVLAFPLYAELAPEGVARLPFTLFLGTAMSVTAFPVLARILTERQLIRTRVGAIALACAAVDDVSAWCLLAFVVAVTGASGLVGAATTTALALGFSALMWFVVRPVLARLGPREGGVVSTDVIALVFLLLIASALATEWIGIHALFGSFLLGAAMPREGGLTSVLAEKLEDFVTIVLLPLFFAYSGLRTQIGLLADPMDWLMCAGIIGVACLGKFGGTALVGRLNGLDGREAAALGVLMNTRGLMELVVLNVGLDLGVISERLFAMMVIMALVTTWMTSPLLRWLYPPGRALLEPVLQPPPVADLPAPAALICVSDPGIAGSLVVLTRALTRRSGGAVWALHLSPIERPHDYLRPDPDEAPLEPLDAVAEAAVNEGLVVHPLSFPSADPAEDIVRVAEIKAVPLVLVGVHRSSLGHDSLGGVAGRVLRDCPVELGVLVDHGLERLGKIALIAGDGPNAAAAARAAERLRAESDVLIVAAGQALPEGVDLVVAPYEPGVSLPEEGGPSWLLTRAAVS